MENKKTEILVIERVDAQRAETVEAINSWTSMQWSENSEGQINYSMWAVDTGDKKDDGPQITWTQKTK